MYISDVKIFYSGYCTHKENIVIKYGAKKQCKFPAIFVLIKHIKHGNILFDTGYAERFFSETTSFPLNIYAKITPVFLRTGECAKIVLEKEGVKADDINYIVISHFHADHIGGLIDFRNAKFIYNADAYNSIKGTNACLALKNGFLAGLIPDNFEARSVLLTNKMKIKIIDKLNPFQVGYDIFGDESIILVDLPGHAKGQIGAYVTKDNNNKYFLVADAVWLTRAYKELKPPNILATIILDNKKEYNSTLVKLHKLSVSQPSLKIIPSHCMDVLGGIPL